MGQPFIISPGIGGGAKEVETIDPELVQARAEWDAWRLKYAPETLNAYRCFWLTMRALHVMHERVAWQPVQLRFSGVTAAMVSYVKADDGAGITQTLPDVAAKTLWAWCRIHLGVTEIKEGVTVVVSTPDSFTPWCLVRKRRAGGASEEWEQFPLCENSRRSGQPPRPKGRGFRAANLGEYSHCNV